MQSDIYCLLHLFAKAFKYPWLAQETWPICRCQGTGVRDIFYEICQTKGKLEQYHASLSSDWKDKAQTGNIKLRLESVIITWSRWLCSAQLFPKFYKGDETIFRASQIMLRWDRYCHRRRWQADGFFYNLIRYTNKIKR